MIESCNDLEGRLAKVHWHWTEKRYSVSLKADNGNWYVVRNKLGHQLFFGKLVLKDASFKVQPAGARKAYETGKRNVHASVIGIVRGAQFQRESAIVPCGATVAYSHSAYPEPEFKYIPVGYEGYYGQQGLRHWPGIEYAEFLVLGTGSMSKSPNMLAAGLIRSTA